MRVLLADDEMNVRSALRLLLEQETGITVAGEATNYGELYDTIGAVNPDLILLDWELPGRRNNGSLSMIKETHPGVRVVVLSSQPEMKKLALAGGATAFMTKDEPPERLINILRKLENQNKDKLNR